MYSNPVQQWQPALAASKIYLVYLASLVPLCLLVGCPQVRTPGGPQAKPAERRGSPIAFQDQQLDDLIRDLLGIESEPITLARAETITCLNLSGIDISSLKGIESLDNLRCLSLGLGEFALSNCQCREKSSDLKQTQRSPLDLTPLRSLNQLRELRLGGQELTNLAVLDGMPSLEVLVLRGCGSGDPSWLTSSPNLRFLDLRLNSVKSINALASAQLPKIEAIELSGNFLSDFGALKQVANRLENGKTLAVSIGGNQLSPGTVLDETTGSAIVSELRASGIKVFAFPGIAKLEGAYWTDGGGARYGY